MRTLRRARHDPHMAHDSAVRRISQGHDRRPPGRPMRLWRRLAVIATYPRRDRGFWYAFAIDLLWPFLVAVARWDYRGGRHVPTQGGALVAVNHLSHIDPIVMVTWVMCQGRVPRFMAMSELWDMKVVGAPLRGGRHIPVDRRASGLAAYRAAVEAVRAGEIVVVYPEGGFAAHSDGWPRAARSGIARMALETGAPVIPAAQWGSQDLLPPTGTRLKLWPRPTLRVLGGEPVELDDLRAGRMSRTALAEATDRIMGRITDLLGELRGETPPPSPETHPAPTPATDLEPPEAGRSPAAG